MRFKCLLIITLCLAITQPTFAGRSFDDLDAFLEKASKIDHEHLADIKKLDARKNSIITKQFVRDSETAQLSADGDTPLAFVLVSMSMPELMVKQYIHQAQKYNASVVLSGLVDNDVKKTKALIEKMVDGKDNAGVIIDPNLFLQYNIKQVPAILVTNEVYPCNGNGCIPENYDVIYGAVKLPFALEQIASSGSSGYQLPEVRSE